MSDVHLEVMSAIRWYMREHDITIDELARRLGVHAARVHKAFTSGNLTTATLDAIADALCADVDVSLKERPPVR